MAALNKTRLLVLGVLLLLVTNAATIIGITKHLRNHETSNAALPGLQNDIINMPRGQFFKSKLDLDQEQTHIFRDLYHQYKEDARQITSRMDNLRRVMVDELTDDSPDSTALQNVAAGIGNLHQQLKQLTIAYFLEMKKNCTPKQAEKLHEIFNSLLNEQGDLRMPNSQGQRRYGRNRIDN